MDHELISVKLFLKRAYVDCLLISTYDLRITEARWDEGIVKDSSSEILMFCSLSEMAVRVFFLWYFIQSYEIEVILDSEDKQLVCTF